MIHDVGADCTYYYKKSHFCRVCGETIAEGLRQRGIVESRDSRRFPQCLCHSCGELKAQDEILFCANGKACKAAVVVAGIRIGLPLLNPLTNAGIARLRSEILDSSLSESMFNRMRARLLYKSWKGYAPPLETLRNQIPSRKIPKHLRKMIMRFILNHGAQTVPRVLIDTEHAYALITSSGPSLDNNPYHLLRIPIDEQGIFSQLKMDSAPLSLNNDRLEEIKLRYPWVGDFLWGAERLLKLHPQLSG